MFELLATVCTGCFAGAAIYISLVQHPALVEAGVATGADFFPRMYRRAAPVQAGLAAVGSAASIVAGLTGSGIMWWVSGVLLFSVIPFTLIRIKPINDRLLAPGLAPESPEIPALLHEWGRLHRYRSVASAIAFVLVASA